MKLKNLIDHTEEIVCPQCGGMYVSVSDAPRLSGIGVGRAHGHSHVVEEVAIPFTGECGSEFRILLEGNKGRTRTSVVLDQSCGG